MSSVSTQKHVPPPQKKLVSVSNVSVRLSSSVTSTITRINVDIERFCKPRVWWQSAFPYVETLCLYIWTFHFLTLKLFLLTLKLSLSWNFVSLRSNSTWRYIKTYVSLCFISKLYLSLHWNIVSLIWNISLFKLYISLRFIFNVVTNCAQVWAQKALRCV